ncbi:MAG: DUF2156 domain-containing protein [Desulfobacteraceae bacterium]|nr:DUF2156 domain-containing protein [Desulfobacteraceae bacterium]
MDFSPVTLEQQEQYLELYSITPQKASDYSFTNLWGWAEEYKLQWAWDKDLVWIRQQLPQPQSWAPVGDWHRVNWNAWAKENPGFEMIRAPETLIQILKSGDLEVEVFETRGSWDYIYRVDELSELKGNRFHKKKNLVNQFRKKYDFAYLEFGKGMVEQALSMQDDWCMWRDCEAHATLSAENRAIKRILSHWDKLRHLKGGAILVDDVMVCYTIAEQISDEMLVIHFEKGNPSYKGSYQAINKIFLEQFDGPCTLVNREQDLDDEGLRKAKLSYNPVDFIRKNRIVISPR